jgi:hypothetical protein
MNDANENNKGSDALISLVAREHARSSQLRTVGYIMAALVLLNPWAMVVWFVLFMTFIHWCGSPKFLSELPSSSELTGTYDFDRATRLSETEQGQIFDGEGKLVLLADHRVLCPGGHLIVHPRGDDSDLIIHPGVIIPRGITRGRWSEGALDGRRIQLRIDYETDNVHRRCKDFYLTQDGNGVALFPILDPDSSSWLILRKSTGKGGITDTN